MMPFAVTPLKSPCAPPAHTHAGKAVMSLSQGASGCECVLFVNQIDVCLDDEFSPLPTAQLVLL